MIWLTGCEGMLGREIARLLETNRIPLIKTSKKEANICNYEEIMEKGRFIFEDNEFDFYPNIIINCAAYTKVDQAETDHENCYTVNTLGTSFLVEIAKKYNACLIHFSTDYVFDGKKNPSDDGYTEVDETGPLNVYGDSKKEGEDSIRDFLSDYYILRTSWLYGSYGKNFVYSMLNAFNEKEFVKVVNDQTGCPTNCKTVSECVLKIVQNLINSDVSNCKIPHGTYHVTDSGKTTWYDFALEIKKQYEIITDSKIKCKIEPCSSLEYKTEAKRPVCSVLNCSKIENKLNIKLPDWKESLYSFLMSENFNSEMIK